jgi:hypothetical protein
MSSKVRACAAVPAPASKIFEEADLFGPVSNFPSSFVPNILFLDDLFKQICIASPLLVAGDASTDFSRRPVDNTWRRYISVRQPTREEAVTSKRQKGAQSGLQANILIKLSEPGSETTLSVPGSNCSVFGFLPNCCSALNIAIGCDGCAAGWETELRCIVGTF